MRANRLLFSIVVLATTLLAALTSMGCASLLNRGGSSSSSSDEETYRGEVGVENRSQLEICTINGMENERRSTETAVELPPGGSATFVTGGGLYRLQLSECGTHRLLYGDPLAWIGGRETVPGQQLRVGRIVVLDPGSSPVDEPGAVSIALVPHEPQEALRDAFFATMMLSGDDGRDFMEDSELAAELLTMLQRGAGAQGWNESFEALVVTVADWQPVQQRQNGYAVTVARDLRFVGGARWPDGQCTLQSFGARQPFDGDEPQGAIGFNGIGDQVVIPCALLEEMTRYPYAATDR